MAAQMKGGSKGIRAALAKLLLAAVAFLIGLGMLEALLRQLPSEEPEPNTGVKSEHTGRLGEPDFRGLGPPPGKSDLAFRIVVVGDSFTRGSGVYREHAYATVLGTRLRDLRSSRPIEVVNWSRSGWGTAEELASLRRSVDWLKPDLVILGFVLNDPEPVGEDERARGLEEARRREPRRGLSSFLHSRSRLYRLLWERLENVRQTRAVRQYYRSLFEGDSWTACRNRLKRLRRLMVSRKIPLLMVVFPLFHGTVDESYPYHAVHEKISAAASEIRIPHLDLRRTFEGIDVRRLVVHPFSDPHPNELAHRMTAEAIAAELVRRDWLPAEG